MKLRCLYAAMCALCILAEDLASQPVVFRGRLIHVDGLSTANVTVGFGGLGSTVVRGSGQFETTLPPGTAEVTVEILDRDWSVLYPRSGRVPVPRDPSTIPEVVVGESVEAATLRLFAERHEKLAMGLEEVGAGQEEIREVLEAFVAEVTDRLAVDATALENEIQLERQRLAHYPALSETITAYIVAAKDLNEYFKLYGDIAFSDRAVYEGLHAAVESYNQVFQRLNNERMAFEFQVATYWESEELRSDLRALFDYALGEVHEIRILQLNRVMPTMGDAVSGRRRDRAAIADAQDRIRRTVEELDLRLAELDRRAERVLGYLTRP